MALYAPEDLTGFQKERTGFYIVEHNNVNVRETAGTDNDKNVILGQVNQGEILSVKSPQVANNDNHLWVNVEYNDRSAWIASDYVRFVETEKPSWANSSYSQSNINSQVEAKTEKVISETGYLEIATGDSTEKYTIYAPIATGKNGDNSRNYPDGGTLLEAYTKHMSFSIVNWGAVIAGVDLDAGGVYGRTDSIDVPNADVKSSYGNVNSPSMARVTLISAVAGTLNAIAGNTMIFDLYLNFSEKDRDIYVSIELEASLGVSWQKVMFDEKGWYFYAFSYETSPFVRTPFEIDMGASFWEHLNIKHHFDFGHPAGKMAFYLFVDQNGEWLARPKKYPNDYVEVVKVDFLLKTFDKGEFTEAKYDLNGIFLNAVHVDKEIREKVEATLRNELNAVIKNDG